jgi:hypothetical protein
MDVIPNALVALGGHVGYFGYDAGYIRDFSEAQALAEALGARRPVDDPPAFLLLNGKPF